MFKNKPVVAIDGPAGSGKSTVAKLVAIRLGLYYLDTGAMYRVITLKAIRNKVDMKSEQALTELANNTDIRFEYGGGSRVYMDGIEVSGDIRLPEVSKSSSEVADSVGVRIRMIELQREYAKDGGIVVDGRDIGSLVFPDADFKFYVDASVEERALRRYRELTGKKIKVEISDVKNDIITRDLRDKNRAYGALKLVPDAVVVDTTKMTIGQVVDTIVKKISGENK